MTVTVESKRLKLTKALQNFATRYAKKLNKLGAKIIKTRVHLETITKKNNDPTSNIATYIISIPGKKVLVVRKKAVDLYQAIVDASHEAVRHLRKVREKRLDRQRAGA